MTATILRKTRQISWMMSGWISSAALGPDGGGTASMTIGCSHDFVAVRVGFANILQTPWCISRLIGCSSERLGNYVVATPNTEWRAFTFANKGQPVDEIVAQADSTQKFTILPNPASTDGSSEPFWTWSDWAPIRSKQADPISGLHVLMLRALVPSNQTICFANGQLKSLSVSPEAGSTFRFFTGGVKFNADRLRDTAQQSADTTEIWDTNHVVPGTLFPVVQFLTQQLGIVGMTTGDSHQQGTSTIDQFQNFLFSATKSLMQDRPHTPFSMMNCALGGIGSDSFFPRLSALLPIVKPSFVVLPGWTYNDTCMGEHANQAATDIFFARLLLAAEQCSQLNIIPVFLTPFPRDKQTMTKVQLGPWREIRERILAMQAQGAVVLDATAVLGTTHNGRFTGTYIEGMSTDFQHPNDAGHLAVAQLLHEKIISLLG